MNLSKKELKQRLVCALTNDVPMCNKCMKCGPDALTARINLIKAISDYLDMSDTTDYLEPIGFKPVHEWED